jgi:uncharacterized membrane protein
MKLDPIQLAKYMVLIFLIDIPWLTITGPLAQRMILKIQGSKLVLRFLPGLLVYVFLAYLLTIPKNPLEAFMLGASVYGVYDFTNYATLKNYSLQFALLDTTWGGALMTIAYFIKRKWNF